MKLLHSNETAAVATIDTITSEKLLEEHEDMLAGAVLNDVTGLDNWLVNRYWEAFPVHDYDRVIGGSDQYVLGNYEADIEEQILLLHVADMPEGCSNIERVDNTVVERSRKDRWSNPEEHKISGWLVHDRPFTKEADPELLAVLSARVGPILVPGSVYSALDGEEGLNDYGFTLVLRRSGHYQINYNPEAIERRPYLAERRKVTKRLQGHWPDDLLRNLAQKIHPSRWPSGHSFDSVVRGPELYETRGWGHRSYNDFGPSGVLELFDLTNKLWPRRYWWRESPGAHSYGATFGNYVQEALEYIHGVEAAVQADHDKLRVEGKAKFDWRVEEKIEVGANGLPLSSSEDDKGENPERELSEKEFIDSYVSGHSRISHETKLNFCKWLRREARAMKIPMPKKPEYPLSPVAQRRLAEKKRKARNKARKQRRRKELEV